MLTTELEKNGSVSDQLVEINPSSSQHRKIRVLLVWLRLQLTPARGFHSSDYPQVSLLTSDVSLQVFLDTQDAYVWLYDPIPWYYWAGGSAIVLGIVAVCLFPLWPPQMRQGVHYLSVAAAGFLVLIIALGIIK